MRIDQFLHTLNYGDAISDEALAISRLLAKQGVESRIYCLHCHEKLKEVGRNLSLFEEDLASSEVNRLPSEYGILLHYSLGSALNDVFKQHRELKRGIIFHNLTPVKWFSAYNFQVSSDLKRGQAELVELIKEADLVLADSQFNCEELKELGCKNPVRLPLVLDEQKWGITPNQGIIRALRGQSEKNILHVGRLAPNKCIEDIIKGFYFYHHKIDKKSRLWLIGSDIDTEIYSFELRRLVTSLSLSEAVNFVGSVSNCELRAFYENCDCYLCMSEHEGFCMPILEAMHFGLPVIAFAACAVPETIGDAGLLLARKSPLEVAELIALLFDNHELRAKVVANGLERAKTFSESSFSQLLYSEVVQFFKNSRV